jgi:putative phosphoesterase
VRVATLYDIHGNLPALDAVLAEVTEERVDRIVVGGDVAAGPFPAETVARLYELGPSVVFIRGNADRELAEGPEKMPEQVRDWLLPRVSESLRAELGSWPEQERLEVDGLGAVLFCHATPRNDEEIFTELTPDEIVAEMFASAPAVTVVGHTHMQVDRRLGDRRIVNSGSVGLPYEGRPGAYWTLLADDIEFRRTEYDVDELVRRATASGVPAAEFYRESLLEPEPRAAVAEFFEGIAGHRADA